LKPFDLARKTQFFTLDVISDVAYSEPFGCLPTDSDVFGYVAAIEESLGAIMLVSTMPKLKWIMDSIVMRMFMPSDTDKRGYGRVIG